MSNKMKTTINAKELRELKACCRGYLTFFKAYGESDATLSQALSTSGWEDIWWLIYESYDEFAVEQKKDLHLLGCDWAESCLINFENKFPEDASPRKAIEAKRDFLNGYISRAELDVAEAAAKATAKAAAEAAAWAAEAGRAAVWAAEAGRAAVWAAEAGRAAAWAAKAAAEAAAWAVSESVSEAAGPAEAAHKSDLMALFLKWESSK